MKRHAGFTLLEILVALVVLGFVIAGLSQGLRFGLRATERQERMSAEQGDLQAVDRLLRRLITQMDPGTARTPASAVGTSESLSFSTDLGAAADALATTTATVRLAAEEGKLVLRWRTDRHVIRFTPPPAPERTVVFDGLDRLELAYWGATDGQAAAWHQAWRQKTLPLLVRIRLVFPAQSGRRWPDIVAAPATPLPMP